jgi:hypothetical protein
MNGAKGKLEEKIVIVLLYQLHLISLFDLTSLGVILAPVLEETTVHIFSSAAKYLFYIRIN